MLAIYFNTPLHPLEKLGGIEDLLDSMIGLGEFFLSNSLIDLDLKEVWFTWLCRIDDFHSEAKPYTASNHSVILVERKVEKRISFTSRFKIMRQSNGKLREMIYSLAENPF